MLLVTKFNRWLCCGLLMTVAAFSSEREEVWDLVVSLVEEQDIGDRSEESAAVLISDTDDQLFVSQGFARRLLSLDSFGRIRRSDQAHRGHSPTVHLGGLYFKSDNVLPPLDPGMEAAAYFFHLHLFGEGFAPGRYIFVKNLEMNRFAGVEHPSLELIRSVSEGDEEGYFEAHPEISFLLQPQPELHLLQVSFGIEGTLGKTFLEEVERGQSALSDLDICSFQQHFLTSLFLLPGDHKGENFIVAGEVPKKLVFVDNDRQFHYPLNKVSAEEDLSLLPQAFGGCKNVLFLLKPLMGMSLHPACVARLLSIDPAQFLKGWLLSLQQMNEKVEGIFQRHPGFAERYARNYLPLKLNEGCVHRLLCDLLILQDHLAHSTPMSRLQNSSTQQSRPFEAFCGPLPRLSLSSMVSSAGHGQPSLPSQSTSKSSIFLGTGVLQPALTCAELFEGLLPDLYRYYRLLQQEHGSVLRTLKQLYSNERPLTQGRIPHARLEGKALKGRWLFNALDDFKRQRSATIEQALQELSHPIPLKLFFHEETATDVVLKNLSDPWVEEAIARQIVDAFLQQSLPAGLQSAYPYSSLSGLIDKYIDNNGRTEELISLITAFAHTQQAWEDFVVSIGKDQSQLIWKTDSTSCLK